LQGSRGLDEGRSGRDDVVDEDDPTAAQAPDPVEVAAARAIPSSGRSPRVRRLRREDGTGTST
jgi:hypothetical protein